MEIIKKQRKGLFLLLCLGVGLLAEISFLHGEVGISYLVFVTGFYMVFFLRYKFAFHHRRIGLLFTLAIWLLSGSYLLYDNQTFYRLNFIVIPLLMLAHIVLITSPKTFKWNTPRFFRLMILKIKTAKEDLLVYIEAGLKRTLFRISSAQAHNISRILFGLFVGSGVLFVLMKFNQMLDFSFTMNPFYSLYAFLQHDKVSFIFRIVFICIVGLIIYSIFQVLEKDHVKVLRKKPPLLRQKWDSLIIIAILICLNVFYTLSFISPLRDLLKNQWQEKLLEGTTMKTSFLALMIVILFNWIFLISCLKFVRGKDVFKQYLLQILYSILLINNLFFLWIAYQRLSVQGDLHGFTIALVLAYAFLVFLLVVFIYTFIQIWIEKISLLHFYLIVGLIFYTAVNVINIERIVVDWNIERFEETGEVNLAYMNSLSDAGLNGLITLYNLGYEDPKLIDYLRDHQKKQEGSSASWQSFNFTSEKMKQQLQRLDIEY